MNKSQVLRKPSSFLKSGGELLLGFRSHGLTVASTRLHLRYGFKLRELLPGEFALRLIQNPFLVCESWECSRTICASIPCVLSNLHHHRPPEFGLPPTVYSSLPLRCGPSGFPGLHSALPLPCLGLRCPFWSSPPPVVAPF